MFFCTKKAFPLRKIKGITVYALDTEHENELFYRQK